MVDQARLQWVNNKQTQEVISNLKQVRTELHEKAEMGHMVYDETRLRLVLCECCVLDNVINYLRTGNYLSTQELKAKVKKEQQG